MAISILELSVMDKNDLIEKCYELQQQLNEYENIFSGKDVYGLQKLESCIYQKYRNINQGVINKIYFHNEFDINNFNFGSYKYEDENGFYRIEGEI